MVSNGLQNQLSRPQFEEAITSLYAVIPETLLSTDALAEEPLLPLKERIAERDDALDAVITDVRTYGLLVRDHSRFDAFKFPHKSFFEYLFGCYVAQYLTSRAPEMTAAIRAATNVKPEAISDMPEALAFAGEIIAKTLPPSSSRPELLDRFFSRIVFGTAKRVPVAIQRAMLLETVAIRIGALYLLFSPIFIAVMLVQVPFMMWITFGMQSSHGDLSAYLATMVAMSLLMPIIVFARRTIRRKKHLLFWFHICKSLGFSLDEISSVYGARAIKALSKMAEREL